MCFSLIGDKKDIRTNVKQYQLSERVLDTVVCDLGKFYCK
jgi:hypothetical protein